MPAGEYFFKLIMLGASGVGKTCIIQRFCNDVYEGPAHKTTLGFDFLTKSIEHKGKKVSLEVWDTAGQEQYKAVTKMYYKDVHGAFLVYDTTDQSSFDKVKFWLDDLEMNGNKLEKRILVGSKIDLGQKREVSLYEAKKFALDRNLEWMECSSKSGEFVDELFEFLIDKIILSYETDDEFKQIACRNTVVSVGPPISEADEMHRSQGYKLHREKLVKKGKKGTCC